MSACYIMPVPQDTGGSRLCVLLVHSRNVSERNPHRPCPPGIGGQTASDQCDMKLSHDQMTCVTGVFCSVMVPDTFSVFSPNLELVSLTLTLKGQAREQTACSNAQLAAQQMHTSFLCVDKWGLRVYGLRV